MAPKIRRCHALWTDVPNQLGLPVPNTARCTTPATAVTAILMCTFRIEIGPTETSRKWSTTQERTSESSLREVPRAATSVGVETRRRNGAITEPTQMNVNLGSARIASTQAITIRGASHATNAQT